MAYVGGATIYVYSAPSLAGPWKFRGLVMTRASPVHALLLFYVLLRARTEGVLMCRFAYNALTLTLSITGTSGATQHRLTRTRRTITSRKPKEVPYSR